MRIWKERKHSNEKKDKESNANRNKSKIRSKSKGNKSSSDKWLRENVTRRIICIGMCFLYPLTWKRCQKNKPKSSNKPINSAISKSTDSWLSITLSISGTNESNRLDTIKAILIKQLWPKNNEGSCLFGSNYTSGPEFTSTPRSGSTLENTLTTDTFWTPKSESSYFLPSTTTKTKKESLSHKEILKQSRSAFVYRNTWER